MKSFKMARMLVWLLLIVSVLTLPVGAAAEVYVETYMGGVFTPNTDMTINTHGSNPNLPAPNIIDEKRHSLLAGQIDPAVLGGLKVGTWFVREGFLGYNYPEWMKYLGFYLDLNYHRISFKRQSGASGVNAVPN